MALMSRPDPMPVEVMSELGEPEEWQCCCLRLSS